MPPDPGFPVALQEAVAAFVRTGDAAAKAYFTDATPAIGVFTEQLGSLQQKIDEGLRKTGISVLVRTVTANKGRNDIPDHVCLGKTMLAFLIGYTPKANPSGLHPVTVAIKLIFVMQRFRFMGVSGEMEALDLLPKQGEDEVHYALIYSFANLKTANEPTR